MEALSFKSALLVFAAMIILFSPAYAQNQEPPVIFVPHPETQKQVPLKLNTLKIDVRVVANIAVTTMEMTFYNENDRVLEGQLYFPLGEGQTVSRFAMDVNGKVREGVVVEKAKGREVFETVVRQNIDPGLLEWTKGNNFKARIYPIPAKGYKKILIAYEQELIDAGKGFLYTLPMNYKEKVDLLSVNAEVFKQDAQPDMGDNQMANLKFEKWNESYIAKQEYQSVIPNKTLAFLLPKEEERQRIFIENSADKIGDSYFYVSIDPKILTEAKKLPEKICLLWDVSNSAASKDIEKELKFLGEYFKKINNLKVELVLFSNSADASQMFEISGGNWEKLAETLKKAVCDGGTQLGALDLSKYTCDEFILSSDGLSNFGESEIKLSSVPVLVINSSGSAEHSYLKYIAKATGGVYINLLNKPVEEALQTAVSNPYSFISAEYDKGAIKETFPSISTLVSKDFTISGMLLKDEAEITLNFGFGGKTKFSKKIKLDKKKHLVECGLIKRVWGQKKISELDMMYKKNEAAITALGKELSIVTRNTSLIVLDRLEDYVTHRIVPPAEMQEEYYTALNWQNNERLTKEKNHLETVLALFKARQEWWNTVFKFGDGKPKKEDAKTEGRDDAPLGFASGNAAESPRPSSVAAEYYDAAEGDAGDEESSDKKSVEGDGGTESSITLKQWDPDTPYLQSMKKESEAGWYALYLSFKKNYANSSAYYLDMADFFMEKGKKELALKVLSNIAEMELENHQLLRILGYRLRQLGYYRLAILIFEEVLKIRSEEPQSYRDIGLTYADNKEYQKAVDYLYIVVNREWDSRFPEIELIALNEMNSIIGTCGQKLNLDSIDSRLVMNMPVDMRVILTWDADLCDMDLWVTDPNGEKCFYSHPNTFIGGLMSKDFTRGYGPEEFLLKRAQPGKYKIEVNYYGNTQQIIAGATTIQVLLTTGFGSKEEKNEAITLRLKDQKEVIEVGEFEFKKK